MSGRPPKKERSVTMVRKAIIVLGGLLMAVGFIVLLGTAGASDVGAIELHEIITHGGAGILAFISGGGLIYSIG